MALPFNPMSLVTPYTAVSTADIGKAFNDARSQGIQNQVSQGYLANTQHQTAENDKRYGQQEVDKAHQELLSAIALGDPDKVEAAANNMRVVGSRYGVTIDELRSDRAEANVAGQTSVANKAVKEAIPRPGQSLPQAPDEESDLSQEDFEKQLIARGENDHAPERWEQGGKTTPEALAYIRPPGGSLPEPSNGPIDMGDVDSLEFQRAAAADMGGSETTQLSPNQEKQFRAWAKRQGITDVDDPRAHYDYRGFWQSNANANLRGGQDHFPDTYKQHGHETFSQESRYSRGPGDGGVWNGDTFVPGVPTPGGSLPQTASAAEPAGASEAPLRGYTLRGPDGKELYKVSPQDVISHQRDRIGAVFDGLPADVADAGSVAEAKKIAQGLVGVLTPQQAVMKGLEHLEQGQQRRGALQITEANHKPRWGGGGGGTGGLLGKGSDAAESVKLYDVDARTEATKIQEEDRQYEAIQGAIDSGDPSVQRDAINQLLKIRSGSAVTAAEDARISRINGILPQLSNMLGQWTGGEMSPEMVNTIRQVVGMKRAANAAKIERIYKHQADLYTVQNKRKVKDPSIIDERAKVLEEGGKPAGGPKDKAHLWE